MKINLLFKKIWCARLISILGTGLTEFGISVWVYYATGEVTPMALTMLCALLPNILISPISGFICDKYNRKMVILLADSFAAAMSLFILIYINLFEFNFGLICVFVFISSLANTFDTNAYQASYNGIVI